MTNIEKSSITNDQIRNLCAKKNLKFDNVVAFKRRQAKKQITFPTAKALIDAYIEATTEGVHLHTHHIGEQNHTNGGQLMTIIDYKGSNTVTVQFEDGSTKITTYRCFKNGKVSPSGERNSANRQKGQSRIGETITNEDGLSMTITAWEDQDHVHVKLWNGLDAVLTYAGFKTGNPRSILNKLYIGFSNTNSVGEKMSIIAYRNADDIDVQFEDGTIVEHTCLRCVKQASLKNPNSRYQYEKQYRNAQKRIGETNKASNGQIMTIVDYENSNHLLIRFEDGYETWTHYSCFKKGNIVNPNAPLKSTLIGQTGISSAGQKMEIIDVKGRDLTVRFEDGTTVLCKRGISSFRRGTIKNPNLPSTVYLQGQKHIGETRLCNVGLSVEIIRWQNSKDITVRFEDGEERKTNYTSFTKKTFKHPIISTDKRRPFVYNKRLCKYITGFDNVAYYDCKCPKCGLDEMISAQELLSHHKCDPYKKKMYQKQLLDNIVK